MSNELKVKKSSIEIQCECGNHFSISEDENDELFLETTFRKQKNEKSTQKEIEGNENSGTEAGEPGAGDSSKKKTGETEKPTRKKSGSGLSIFNK